MQKTWIIFNEIDKHQCYKLSLKKNFFLLKTIFLEVNYSADFNFAYFKFYV